MKKDDFVHLHVHSDMSQLDGCGTIGSYTSVAAKRGNPAIAITDHGTMRGYFEAHQQAEKSGIKPIYGIEFYVSRNMLRKGVTAEEREEICSGLKKSEFKAAIKAFEEREGIRDRWHLTVWARSQEGLQNLFKLSSASYIDGFYYKPRIDIQTLIKYGDGLAVGTGCLASVINDYIRSGKRRAALEEADRLFERFGSDLWLEVQPHDLEEQVVANQFALKLRKRYGGKVKLLATQDAHYVKRSDAIHHDVMLCIGTHAYLDQEQRFRFPCDGFYLKNRKQMKRSFLDNHGYFGKKRIKEALDNTMLFAEKCDAKVVVDYLAAILPHVEVDEGYKSELDFFKALCFQGWVWRDIDKRARRLSKIKNEKRKRIVEEYKQRLVYETNMIKNKKFVPYFLIVRDIYNFARQNRIMVGPGRGSAAGSLVSFLLGITSIDPIEHGLLFERFMNPDRIDMPDIDMDFEKIRRQEILGYLRDKYGNDRVAQIATVNKLKGRQCLKDVSRVLRVPLKEVETISSSILERSKSHQRTNKTVVDSMKEFPNCREFDKKYPNVAKHADALEGLAKALGIHAAGIVVSPDTISKYVPLETRDYEGERVVVTALDMNGVAAIGLVKLDVLGLKTLTVIRQCLEAVEKKTGVWIDLESLWFDDSKVLQGFSDNDFSGVFQFDTASAGKLCEGVPFSSFTDLAAINALNRPSGTQSGLASEWAMKKKNPERVKEVKFHKLISEIARDTLGVIAYQEHVNKIFMEVAGFEPAKAETLRKKISKSKGREAIEEIKGDFVKGAVKLHSKNGMTKELAEKIIDAIGFFGGYGFNKSHSVSYAAIAYWCMYLKIYHPLEFYWSLLVNEEKTEKIQHVAKEAKRSGIKILSPDINVSKDQFSIDPKQENTIRGSLADIKGVGLKAIESIVEARKKGEFSCFEDFLNRVYRRTCNKSVVKALLKSGAFNRMVPNIKPILDDFDEHWKHVDKAGYFTSLIDDSKDMEGYSKEEESILATQVNPFSFGEHPVVAYKDFIEKNIKVKITSLEGDDFYQKNRTKSIYVAGIIVGTKISRVGDYHTGELPSEKERELLFWGNRYASINVEGREGTQRRIKFDIDVFDRCLPIIDKGIGTPVLIHLNSISSTYKSAKADFLVDLEEMRKKISSGDKLGLFEGIVIGKHPVKKYKWKKESTKQEMLTHKRFNKSSSGGIFCGVVTHISLKYDKKNKQMAFVGINGCKKHIEVVFFASIWSEVKYIKEGDLIKIAVKKQRQKERGLSYIYNGEGLKVLS